MIVVLDNIRSVHNVGSIFRTADASGCKKIYLCGITPGPVDKWGRAVKAFTKVSLSAEKTVNWERVESTFELISILKKQGYKILALEQSKNSISIYEAKTPTKTALVVGPEVEGLGSQILDLADEIVEIPMFGKKESLNVSVAFGVAVYILLAQTLAK